MADARKVFPMSTFVAFLKGVEQDAQKQNIRDLLAFMTQRDITDENEPFAAALCKAHVYEQNPELVRLKSGEVAGLGDNVSVTELPAEAKLVVDASLAKIETYPATIAKQAEKIAGLEKDLAGATAKLHETEKAMAEYKGKAEAFESSQKGEGEKVLVTSQAKVEEYIGKVDELLKMIEDVKKHGVVTVAAGDGSGAGAAAPAEEAGVPDDFGFGSTGANSDGFGF